MPKCCKDQFNKVKPATTIQELTDASEYLYKAKWWGSGEIFWSVPKDYEKLVQVSCHSCVQLRTCSAGKKNCFKTSINPRTVQAANVSVSSPSHSGLDEPENKVCREKDTYPPPCTSTAAVPKVQADQRFNAHPPCVDKPLRARDTHTRKARHTHQQSAVHDSHAGSGNVGQGRTSPPTKPHGAVMCGTML